MLEATADANNRNAYDMAIKSYKSAMDAVAGKKCTATRNEIL